MLFFSPPVIYKSDLGQRKDLALIISLSRSFSDNLSSPPFSADGRILTWKMAKKPPSESAEFFQETLAHSVFIYFSNSCV